MMKPQLIKTRHDITPETVRRTMAAIKFSQASMIKMIAQSSGPRWAQRSQATTKWTRWAAHQVASKLLQEKAVGCSKQELMHKGNKQSLRWWMCRNIVIVQQLTLFTLAVTQDWFQKLATLNNNKRTAVTPT